jgi:RNA ligase
MAEFIPFRKIPRLSRDIIVTEKIDGTNAAVQIVPVSCRDDLGGSIATVYPPDSGPLAICAQSRNRFITPWNDNYGFAAWVKDNATELATLGVGCHFGEWWGSGIQRRYGLSEKRFSLFNVSRWTDDVRPNCCSVVPTLYAGTFDEAMINGSLTHLLAHGSVAAPGFMSPEGIIVFHTASGQMFKKTALGIDGHKEAA